MNRWQSLLQHLSIAWLRRGWILHRLICIVLSYYTLLWAKITLSRSLANTVRPSLSSLHLLTMTNTEYTCFANKLSRLTRLPGPVRAMKSPDDGVSERQSVNAPREFMKLINWLMTHVTDPVRVSLILTSYANGLFRMICSPVLPMRAYAWPSERFDESYSKSAHTFMVPPSVSTQETNFHRSILERIRADMHLPFLKYWYNYWTHW